MIKSYELSYTAKDINEKLGKIDELENAISDIENGSVGKAGVGEGAEIFNCYEDIEYEEVDEDEVYTYTIPANKALGKYSHAEGAGTHAIGDFSHAEGENTVAYGEASHAEGCGVSFELILTGDANSTTYTYSEDCEGHWQLSVGGVVALGDARATIVKLNRDTCTIMLSNTLSADAIAGKEARLLRGVAYGAYSHVEGNGTNATGHCSHAEGAGTIVTGDFSHAEGMMTGTDGYASHAEGTYTWAMGPGSHAEGARTTAFGGDSHAEGSGSGGYSYYLTGEAGATVYTYDRGNNDAPLVNQIVVASVNGSTTCAAILDVDTDNNTITLDDPLSDNSFSDNVAIYSSGAYGGTAHSEGNSTLAVGYASHAEGTHTTAASEYQHVQGKYNIADSNNQYAHIVGNGGYATPPSNAHTLDWEGNAVFAGTVSAPGADYAEHFEWLDGNPNNEDRIGTIVALDGDKIRPATANDEILGVVSGTAMVIGDNAEWEWQGKFLTDNYGRVITEMVEEFVDVRDHETGEVVDKKSVGFFPHRKLNPEWDANQKYTRRSDRPEWDVVGLFGKLHVNDDGTCVPNGWVTVGEDGRATASATKTNMRVMKRITDNIVLVFMK